jgi:hypothetical protein
MMLKCLNVFTSGIRRREHPTAWRTLNEDFCIPFTRFVTTGIYLPGDKYFISVICVFMAQSINSFHATDEISRLKIFIFLVRIYLVLETAVTQICLAVS